MRLLKTPVECQPDPQEKNVRTAFDENGVCTRDENAIDGGIVIPRDLPIFTLKTIDAGTNLDVTTTNACPLFTCKWSVYSKVELVTDDGTGLLPIKRKWSFDCEHNLKVLPPPSWLNGSKLKRSRLKDNDTIISSVNCIQEHDNIRKNDTVVVLIPTVVDTSMHNSSETGPAMENIEVSLDSKMQAGMSTIKLKFISGDKQTWHELCAFLRSTMSKFADDFCTS